MKIGVYLNLLFCECPKFQILSNSLILPIAYIVKTKRKILIHFYRCQNSLYDVFLFTKQGVRVVPQISSSHHIHSPCTSYHYRIFKNLVFVPSKLPNQVMNWAKSNCSIQTHQLKTDMKLGRRDMLLEYGDNVVN